MAELTPEAGNAQQESSNATSAAAAPPDPRAVRVRLGAASRGVDDPAMRIAPPPEPLLMTNPTVGTGPLGGAVIAPTPGPSATVLAQRHVLVDGLPIDASLQALGGGRYLLLGDGAPARVVLEPDGPGEGGSRAREAIVDGFRFVVETEPERVASLRERASQGRAASVHGGPLQVKAIIPGKVVAVSVTIGDTVTAGQQLLVVEAMKMQNELRAPRDGAIERVGVAVGANIEIGDLLVVIS
jgi:biotin carboxyl carrier protein